MKKMLKLLLTLFLIYFGIQYIVNLFSKNHDIEYKLDTSNGSVSIREILTASSDENSYYFGIDFNNQTIPFKVYNVYDKRRKMVKEVQTFVGDTYTCAYIKLDNNVIPSDMKCVSNGISYLYTSIKGIDNKLDQAVSSSNYNQSKFVSDETVSADKDNIKYYKNNYISNQNILLDGYKGVYLFGDKVTSYSRLITLYDTDVYSKVIETSSGKYYLVADYASSHEFSNFIVINIENGDSYTITSDYDISFDSFVEGTVDNMTYVLDTENKKQYEIDIKGKSIKLVGNEEHGAQIYSDGNWSVKNINEAIDNKITFGTNAVSNVNNITYDRMDLVGSTTTGTYYIYTKNGSNYDVYAIYTQDSNMTKNYLFTTDDINRIAYRNGYVYYVVDNQLRVYGTDCGNRLILSTNELKYNKNLHFYVY